MIVAEIEKSHMPVSSQADLIDLSYSSLMRWRSRIKQGKDPVKKPGPGKIKPFDFNKLKNEINHLKHGHKRTAGTGKLYNRYHPSISRRELSRLVTEARRAINGKKRSETSRIIWHHPGIAWTVDDSEKRLSSGKLFMHNIQDICSKYKLPPIASSQKVCGEEVAGHLSRLFEEFGKPLFLKRDNGGNLNHSAVNDELKEHMIIPINSPCYYPQYNGAIEHTQGEFKNYLAKWSCKADTLREYSLLTETAAHDLNHKFRRSLNMKNSCSVFNGNNRVTFSRRKRKEVYEWIKNLTLEILEKLGDKGSGDVAWRIAATSWLQKNNFITIIKNGKVLPDFSKKFCHN